MIKGPNLNNAVNQYLEEPIGASNFVVNDGTGQGENEMAKLDSLIDDFQRASGKDE